jgi:hypothetical protein
MQIKCVIFDSKIELFRLTYEGSVNVTEFAVTDYLCKLRTSNFVTERCCQALLSQKIVTLVIMKNIGNFLHTPFISLKMTYVRQVFW